MLSKSSALHNRHAWIHESIWRAPHVRALSPAAKDVLVYLYVWRNGETGRCWPSLHTLAADLGYDRVTMYRAVCELRAAGALTTTREPPRDRLVYTLPSVCDPTDREPTTVCDPTDRQGGPLSVKPSRDCLRNRHGLSVAAPTPSLHCIDTQSNTTTRTSRDGSGGVGAAAQDSEGPIADVDQPEVWKALVSHGIGEPALSELAGNPWIDAHMVRRVAAECFERDQGTGLLILALQREAKAAKLAHDQQEVDRKADRTAKASRLCRLRRYKRIIRQADDAQRIVIRKRWKYPGAVAADNPIPGDRLFNLDPVDALHEIIDAVHASTA